MYNYCIFMKTGSDMPLSYLWHAAGTACNTVPTWEQKLSATEGVSVFTAGMPVKLTQVQYRRHASGKDLWCFFLPVALCPHMPQQYRRQHQWLCPRFFGGIHVWEPGLMHLIFFFRIIWPPCMTFLMLSGCMIITKMVIKSYLNYYCYYYY